MALTPDVGKDIESICGKCGDTWHVVVAKVGDKIAKVLCKQCNGQHRYRPPGGTPRKTATRKASTGPKTPGPKKTRGPNLPHAEIEPNLSIPTQAYKLSERYEAGMRIDHPKFGVGLVESEIGKGKIQVCFPDARRILVHERVLD